MNVNDGPKEKAGGRGNAGRRGKRLPESFLALFGFSALWAAGAIFFPPAAPLDSADKAVLSQALRLKSDLGEEIWPGFGRAEIPIVLYDENFEYLFGEPKPPEPWEAVAGEDFEGRPYFRRPAADPQAFAVRVGARWAGSLPTLSYTNRKTPLKLGADWFSLSLLHEMFHAFQAEAAPDAFAAALSVYERESRYPYENEDFKMSWKAEGACLAEALQAKGTAEIVSAAAEFLKIREARRNKIELAPELIGFEQKLEWLEGLAEYVQIKADESAVARADRDAYALFRSGLHFVVRSDFFRLEKALDAQAGDLRFYLSGMAVARILDRLEPAWKENYLKNAESLERILHDAVGKNRR